MSVKLLSSKDLLKVEKKRSKKELKLKTQKNKESSEKNDKREKKRNKEKRRLKKLEKKQKKEEKKLKKRLKKEQKAVKVAEVTKINVSTNSKVQSTGSSNAVPWIIPENSSVSTQRPGPIVVQSGKSQVPIPVPIRQPIPVPIRRPVGRFASSIEAENIAAKSRPTQDINPIYRTNRTNNNNIESNNNFVIPGLNDTNESEDLVRHFANRWMSLTTLNQIEAQTGLKYRRGHFSEAERSLARRLVDKHCQDQGVTLDHFKGQFFAESMNENDIQHGRISAKFFVEIAQYFGGRPVSAVYQFLKRMFHPGNHRGAWTSEEDQNLKIAYDRLGPKWAQIGRELNRLGINCRDRYNIIWKHRDTTQRGFWTEEEDTKLKAAITQSINTSGQISWMWVSEFGVVSRTPLQCLNRWKTLKNNQDLEPIRRTRSKSPIDILVGKWTESQDYLLCHELLEYGALEEDFVNWNTLSTKLENSGLSGQTRDSLFNRWNFLKEKASLSDDNSNLKSKVEAVKNYLLSITKSSAYIFSEDEES